MSERLFDLKEGAQVGIVSGSASDKETVDKVTAVLDQLGVSWEFNVLSAHRAPNKLARYMKEAKPRGLKAMVGVAGLAAALPGVMASHTTLPVIGVPCAGGPLSGVDALCTLRYLQKTRCPYNYQRRQAGSFLCCMGAQCKRSICHRFF